MRQFETGESWRAVRGINGAYEPPVISSPTPSPPRPPAPRSAAAGVAII